MFIFSNVQIRNRVCRKMSILVVFFFRYLTRRNLYPDGKRVLYVRETIKRVNS